MELSYGKEITPNWRRKIPVQVSDLKTSKIESLMMIMDIGAKGLVFDRQLISGDEFDEFDRKFKTLRPNEIKNSLSVTKTEFQMILSQIVECVGCRRSVERLYTNIMENNYSTLDPIFIRNGVLSVCDHFLQSSQLMCTLLYNHDSQLNLLLENQPRNKKNSRCNLHQLDSFRTKPFSENWQETWDSMKKNCKEKITLIEAEELHEILNDYLKKHKFCQECRTKVEKAYTLLMIEPTPAKEKGYVATIYQGIKRCLKDKHIHLPTKVDYIDELIKRAEPEIVGSNSRHRERHAKSLEIAQEEVLTCIGMCIYNRLSAVSRSVKEELNACQVLAAVSVHALSRSFDISVERKKGVNLELIYDEISREDRLKEEQQKKRKIKKRKKRNEKKDLKTFNCNLSLVPGKCYENDSNVICDEIEPNVIEVISNVERSRSASVENLGVKMDEMSITSCRSCNYGDAGYSSECHNDCILSNNISSRTSSIVSTPEGSEMACSDSCCKETAHVETFLTLEQMLNEETGDTEYGIPDEEIEEFRSRDDIKQKREELREKLLRNFNELRAKCCLNTRKQK